MQIQLCVLGLKVRVPRFVVYITFFFKQASCEHLSLECEGGYNRKTMHVFFAIVFFASNAFPGKCR